MQFKNAIFWLVVFFLLKPSRSDDVDSLNVKEYLYNYGFVNSTDIDEATVEKAITKFQIMTGLRVTGNLTNETVKKMLSPRCGRASSVPTLATHRYLWHKSHLTYIIKNMTSSTALPVEDIKFIVDESLKKWTSKADLKVTGSVSRQADIEMFFSEQDGSGNVLGYAYSPENGDIYFDKDEDWTTDNSMAYSKISFVWVAAHELGHALGLRHSEFQSSIMYPYYSPEVTEPSTEDIDLLSSLYGMKFDKSILCSDISIDAILDDGDNSIVIKGNQYWTLSEKSLQHGPFSLEELFPDLPNKINAAAVIQGVKYFFSGNRFYRFKNKQKKFTRKLIVSGFGDVPTDLDAVFFDKNEIIYFFKGTKYYAINIHKKPTERLIVKNKDISKDWEGVPNDIEAATMLNNCNIFFVKGMKCYEVDLASKKVLTEEDCSSTFYGCKN